MRMDNWDGFADEAPMFRPCQSRRFAPKRTLADRRTVQRERQHLQSWNRRCREDLRSCRSPHSLRALHPTKELVRCWVRWFSAASITMHTITTFDAHPDYIRCLAVHPLLSFVLTGLRWYDDQGMGWGWAVEMHSGFRGYHALRHGTRLQPKDTNTFASSCLDRSVKMCVRTLV